MSWYSNICTGSFLSFEAELKYDIVYVRPLLSQMSLKFLSLLLGLAARESHLVFYILVKYFIKLWPIISWLQSFSWQGQLWPWARMMTIVHSQMVVVRSHWIMLWTSIFTILLIVGRVKENAASSRIVNFLQCLEWMIRQLTTWNASCSRLVTTWKLVTTAQLVRNHLFSVVLYVWTDTTNNPCCVQWPSKFNDFYL